MFVPMLRRMLAPFAWVIAYHTGRNVYWRNTVTGARRVSFGQGGYQPVDLQWLSGGARQAVESLDQAPELVVLSSRHMAERAGFTGGGVFPDKPYIRAWWPGMGLQSLHSLPLARVTIDSSVRPHLDPEVRSLLRKKQQAYGHRATWLEL